LPAPPTALVGRARELTTLAEMLQHPDTRLVTLTGAGGVGKTQLAVAVAHALAGDFPDGASFVPLAALSDPALVIPAVGRATGIADLDPVDAHAALTEHLRPLRHLLVLDNLEHLTTAAPQIAALAAACPGLAVLVTSWASQRVRGETAFPVQPLALPAETHPGVAAVMASPAGALFAARARAVRPDFAVTEDNVAAVTAVCRRLAGIPLALELAAARLRYLEPDVLLARLDDAMAREGPRDLPARQCPMRAAIDWSYRSSARTSSSCSGGCRCSPAVSPSTRRARRRAARPEARTCSGCSSPWSSTPSSSSPPATATCGTGCSNPSRTRATCWSGPARPPRPTRPTPCST
jgi:hypothetical protein